MLVLRTQSVYARWAEPKDGDFIIFCFAEKEDVELFAAEFEGISFDPKRDRGKGAQAVLGQKVEPLRGYK